MDYIQVVSPIGSLLLMRIKASNIRAREATLVAYLGSDDDNDDDEYTSTYSRIHYTVALAAVSRHCICKVGR